MATKKEARATKKKKKPPARKTVRKKAVPKKVALKKKTAAKPKAAPKAKRAAPGKPTAMPKPPVPAAPPGMERIGIVTHYYNHLSVAIVQLETGSLRVGDLIHIKGHTSDFVKFDQTEQLPDCMVPMHVIAFEQDVQAVPQDNMEVAELAGNGHYHEFAGMGHCSIYGHTQDILNPIIEDLIRRYL